jgi:hypothetical protein
MSLENVTADASAERNEYHKLDFDQLEKLDDAEALFQRGIRLVYGMGVRMDGNSGWELIISSAKLGHPVALALCFIERKGTEWNMYRAGRLLRDSASRGYGFGIPILALFSRFFLAHMKTTALIQLGFWYESNWSERSTVRDIEEDKQEAIHLYRLAIDRGIIYGFYRLGYCFQYGNAVAMDEQEAVRFYRVAALAGDSWSQYWLGNCYRDGIGVETNRLMAACFYRLADELGNKFAQQNFNSLDLSSDVQDESAIVDAVCDAASDASDETREAALQWLLTQRHDEVSMLVCDLRVESMCFRVDCFLAFSFVQSTFPTLVRFVRFEM